MKFSNIFLNQDEIYTNQFFNKDDSSLDFLIKFFKKVDSREFKENKQVDNLLKEILRKYLKNELDNRTKKTFECLLKNNFSELKNFIFEIYQISNLNRSKYCVLLYASMAKIDSENFDLLTLCNQDVDHLNEIVDIIIYNFKKNDELGYFTSKNEFNLLDLLRKIDFLNSKALSSLNYSSLSNFLSYLCKECFAIDLSNCQLHSVSDCQNTENKENVLKRKRNYDNDDEVEVKKRRTENSLISLSLGQKKNSLMLLLPTQLQYLFLNNSSTFCSHDLESLSHRCKNLTCLSISEVSRIDKNDWALLKTFSHLTSLSLKNCSNISNEVIEDILKNCKNLQKIELMGSDANLSLETQLGIAVINRDLESVKKLIAKGSQFSKSRAEEDIIKEICKETKNPLWIHENHEFLMALAKKRFLPTNLSEAGSTICNILYSCHPVLCRVICENYNISIEAKDLLDKFNKNEIKSYEFTDGLYNLGFSLRNSENLINNMILKETKLSIKSEEFFTTNLLEYDEYIDEAIQISFFNRDFERIPYLLYLEQPYTNLSQIKLNVNLLLDKTPTKIVDYEYEEFFLNGGNSKISAIGLSEAIKKIANKMSSKNNTLSKEDIAVKELFNNIFIGLGIYSKWTAILENLNYSQSLKIRFVAEEIVELIENSNVTFPIWIPANTKDHVIVVCLIDKKDLIITNTGDQVVTYHQKKGISNEFETSLPIKNIPLETLKDVSFWEKLLLINSGKESHDFYKFLTEKFQIQHLDPHLDLVNFKSPQMRGSCSILPFIHQTSCLINKLPFSKNTNHGLDKFFISLIKCTLGEQNLQEFDEKVLTDSNEQEEFGRLKPLMIEAIKKEQDHVYLSVIAKDDKLFEETLEKFYSWLKTDENDRLESSKMTWPEKFYHLHLLAKKLGFNGSHHPDLFRHFLIDNLEDKKILSYSKRIFLDRITMISLIIDLLNKDLKTGDWIGLAIVIADDSGEFNPYIDFIAKWVCANFSENDENLSKLFCEINKKIINLKDNEKLLLLKILINAFAKYSRIDISSFLSKLIIN